MTQVSAETIKLPTKADYDRAIEMVDARIVHEGSPLLYLRTIVDERQNSKNFWDFRVEACRVALNLETHHLVQKEHEDPNAKVEYLYTLSDKQHKLANTVLSGMIFGRFINEELFFTPQTRKRLNWYSPSTPLLEGETLEEFEAIGEDRMFEALRIVYGVMSETARDRLSEDAKLKLDHWALQVTDIPERQDDFVRGIGIELQVGYEYEDYRRIVAAQHSSQD